MAKKFIKLGIKSVKGEKGVFEFIASNAAVDRDGEVIDPKGWDIKNFQKNPVILWAHNYHELPIGKAIKITKTADMLKVAIEFASKEANSKAEQVKKLVEEGILNTVSVGFIPKARDEKDSTKIIEAELLEVSLVPVPSNPEALALAMAKGYSKDLFRELKKKGGHKPKPNPKKKDVAETIALAGMLDHLEFLIFMFGQNEVSDKVTSKMQEALKLIMEALKMEATIGRKGFEFTQEALAKQRDKTTIQTVIMSKEIFKTVAEARAWLKDNDFKSGKVDEKEDSFRFRQFSPKECKDGSFRTINLTEGVSAVICKKNKEVCETDNKDLISHLTERIVSELLGKKNPPTGRVEVKSKNKGSSVFVEVLIRDLRKRTLERYKYDEKILAITKQELLKIQTHEQGSKTHKKGT